MTTCVSHRLRPKTAARHMAPSEDRPLSRVEEMTSSVSHAVALVAALVVAPFLVMEVASRNNPAELVGVIIFIVALAMVYAASMLHHGLPDGRAKDVFQVIDHGVIFLLIAGTYTPLTLGVLRGRLGWTLFGLVWTFAVAGIALKAVRGVRHPKISLCLYLATGWVVAPLLTHVWARMPFWGFFWIALGGLVYTAGVPFYRADRIPYFHFVWHLFVIGGGVCHCIAIFCYGG